MLNSLSSVYPLLADRTHLVEQPNTFFFFNKNQAKKKKVKKIKNK